MTMKKVIIAIILIFAFIHIANAQIKVVGDEYSDTLSAAKSYYEQDVEFEKVFPRAYLGAGYNIVEMGVNCAESYNSIKMTIPTNLNCLGDTLWNYSNKNFKNIGLYDRMESYGFGIITDEEKEEVTWEIPMGYYAVSGYIIGRENLIELLSKYFRDDQKNIILHYKNEKEYLRTFSGIGTTGSIKQLKEAILKSEFNYLPDKYIAYVKLSSLDTINNKRIDYYTPNLSRLFNVNYYSEIRKQFLNQEIILVRGDNYIVFNSKEGEAYRVKQDVIDEGEILSDAMTDESLKLADNVFTVMDVVVKLKKSGPQLYVIVRGENTGSFAIQPKSIGYKYYVSDFDDERNGMRRPNYTNYEYPYLELEAGYSNHFYAIKRNDYYKIWQHVTDSVAMINKQANQKKLNEERRRLSYQRERELKEKQRKEEFQNGMIAKYGLENGRLVGNKRIAIGMTKEMCKDAWGSPMDSYSTTTKYGKSEVWCYNYKTRVYFYNGKVVRIDD